MNSSNILALYNKNQRTEKNINVDMISKDKVIKDLKNQHNANYYNIREITSKRGIH